MHREYTVMYTAQKSAPQAAFFLHRNFGCTPSRRSIDEFVASDDEAENSLAGAELSEESVENLITIWTKWSSRSIRKSVEWNLVS